MANIMSPLRLTTYRNEEKNTQTFQFVLSEYENEQVSQWESLVSGASAIVQDVTEIDTMVVMYYVVKENPSDDNLTPLLFLDQTPKLYKETPTGRVEDGKVVYGGALEPFDVTASMYALSGVSILKNGVVLNKEPGSMDVTFVETNYIRILSPLQVGDIIRIERILA